MFTLSLSSAEGILPSNQSLMCHDKLFHDKALSKLICNLLCSINRLNVDLLVHNFSPKPMVRDGNMLGARSKLWHTSHLQTSIVVFINIGCRYNICLCIHIFKGLGMGGTGRSAVNLSFVKHFHHNFLQDLTEGNQVAHTLRQSNILSLQG